VNNNPDFLPSLTTDLANKKAAIADSEERRPEMIKGTLIRNYYRLALVLRNPLRNLF
jgi:hypothetical protein